MNVEIARKATVTFESEGHKIKMNIIVMGDETNIKVEAENPENLQEHRGLHVTLSNIFYQALTEE